MLVFAGGSAFLQAVGVPNIFSDKVNVIGHSFWVCVLSRAYVSHLISIVFFAQIRPYLCASPACCKQGTISLTRKLSLFARSTQRVCRLAALHFWVDCTSSVSSSSSCGSCPVLVMFPADDSTAVCQQRGLSVVRPTFHFTRSVLHRTAQKKKSRSKNTCDFFFFFQSTRIAKSPAKNLYHSKYAASFCTLSPLACRVSITAPLSLALTHALNTNGPRGHPDALVQRMAAPG